MMESGNAFCVPGNHDIKLMRWLQGKQVQVKHGLEQSIADMETLEPADRSRIAAFLHRLVSHYVFDEGKLVVAHAGLREENSRRVIRVANGTS